MNINSERGGINFLIYSVKEKLYIFHNFQHLFLVSSTDILLFCNYRTMFQKAAYASLVSIYQDHSKFCLIFYLFIQNRNILNFFKGKQSLWVFSSQFSTKSHPSVCTSHTYHTNFSLQHTDSQNSDFQSLCCGTFCKLLTFMAPQELWELQFSEGAQNSQRFLF